MTGPVETSRWTGVWDRIWSLWSPPTLDMGPFEVLRIMIDSQDEIFCCFLTTSVYL